MITNKLQTRLTEEWRTGFLEPSNDYDEQNVSVFCGPFILTGILDLIYF
jgi:hypothetical protein